MQHSQLKLAAFALSAALIVGGLSACAHKEEKAEAKCAHKTHDGKCAMKHKKAAPAKAEKEMKKKK